MRLLSNLLRRFIRQGTLRVRDADGKVHLFGNREQGPDVAIHLRDRKLNTKLFINPELYVAEAYMDGTLTLEGGSAFRNPEHDALEQAQRYKLIHATSKLQLKPGMTVAEIGSGWGGFAIHLARETGAHVTAINFSPE